MSEPRLESDCDDEKLDITVSCPALEPFETLYGTANHVAVEPSLPTKEDPVMLGGIWKKRPWFMLKSVCRNELEHYGSKWKASLKNFFDRIRRAG